MSPERLHSIVKVGPISKTSSILQTLGRFQSYVFERSSSNMFLEFS